MRSLFIFLLLVGSCFGQTPEDASVRVYVYTNNDNRPDKRGSGVLLTETQVLTNAHVVSGRRNRRNAVSVRFKDRRRSWATVQIVDNRLDVALLKIHPHETFEPLEYDLELEEGDEVQLHGFGSDYEYIVKDGTVGPRRKITYFNQSMKKSKVDPKGPWFSVDVVARKGDSGGPITKHGKLVGILHSTNNERTDACRLDAIFDKFKDKFVFSVLRIK